MNYIEVTELRYADKNNQFISCMVRFAEFENSVPFIATANDPEIHGAEIYNNALAGNYGKIQKYTPTPEDMYLELIQNGVIVISDKVSSLNGTYCIDSQSQLQLNQEAQYVSMYGEFSTGSFLEWPDKDGNPHIFKTTASFMKFSKGVAQFLIQCKKTLNLLNSGSVSDFPNNLISIP